MRLDIAKDTVRNGIFKENPIFHHVLGICSALAVTGFVKTTLFMCFAIIFVASLSSLLVSLIREWIPNRVRLITQMIIISLLVIVVDLYLQAYHFTVSQMLGPYVGLIITNCLILGRTESYALRNTPLLSMFDGLGSALGYSTVLIIIAVIRELLGYGTLLGFRMLPPSYIPNLLMNAVPGAFITMGIVIWIVRSIYKEEDKEHPEATYHE